MDTERDPNVIYGGDPEVFGPIMDNCASLGEVIIKNLKSGANRTSLVSKLNSMYESSGCYQTFSSSFLQDKRNDKQNWNIQ